LTALWSGFPHARQGGIWLSAAWRFWVCRAALVASQQDFEQCRRVAK
jgi:hypothetical protein